MTPANVRSGGISGLILNHREPLRSRASCALASPSIARSRRHFLPCLICPTGRGRLVGIRLSRIEIRILIGGAGSIVKATAMIRSHAGSGSVAKLLREPPHLLRRRREPHLWPEQPNCDRHFPGRIRKQQEPASSQIVLNQRRGQPGYATPIQT